MPKDARNMTTIAVKSCFEGSGGSHSIWVNALRVQVTFRGPTAVYIGFSREKC